MLAGGMADGSIGLWNPAKLALSNGGEASPVATLKKHTGAVRTCSSASARSACGRIQPKA